jgi:hypothetical protein
MKLIIERTEHGLYAYRETEKHHKYVEKTKQRETRLRSDILADECHLETIMGIGEYFVFDIKRGK